MDNLPFLLQHQSYTRTLPCHSFDFYERMVSIFGERLSDGALMAPHVLILTRTDDREADAVGRQLLACGIPYLRMNVETLPTTATLALREGAEGVEPVIGVRGHESSAVRVIWFRHFDVAAIPSSCHDSMAQRFIQMEWDVAIRGLLSIDSARWVNRPDTIHALDRLAQLRLACIVGLATPRTLVSNDPAQIRSFVASCSGKTIIKVLGDHFIEPTPGMLRGVFPRVITASDLDTAAVAVAPSMYQDYIPHTLEVRATVIGDDIIAAAVLKGDIEDIWEHPDKVLVREHTLPADIQEKLRAYMKLSGLSYGAFDLLVERDDRYVFLEVNPIGDWLWLEARNAAIDITKKVTSYIVGLTKETVS